VFSKTPILNVKRVVRTITNLLARVDNECS